MSFLGAHLPTPILQRFRQAQFQVTDFFDNFSVTMELKEEVGELLGESMACGLGDEEHRRTDDLYRNVWLVCVMFSLVLKSFHCWGIV